MPARLASLIEDAERPVSDRLCAARALFESHTAMQSAAPAVALAALPDDRIEGLSIGLLSDSSLELRSLAARQLARGLGLGLGGRRAPMPQCPAAPMPRCANAPMRQCANALMRQCANALMR